MKTRKHVQQISSSHSECITITYNLRPLHVNYTSHNSHDTTFKAARARSFAQTRREQVAYTGAYDRIDCCRKFERGETQDAKSGSHITYWEA